MSHPRLQGKISSWLARLHSSFQARQGTNLIAGWYGFLGVSYRLYSSMNLVDWLPHGEPFTGGNAPMQVPLPLDGASKKFFHVRAIH